MRTIHRYEVPVDNRWHYVEMTGDIVHVAVRELDAMQVWALVGDHPKVVKELCVFGTGQPIPAGYNGSSLRHVGTALVCDLRLACHLFQRMAEAGS